MMLTSAPCGGNTRLQALAQLEGLERRAALVGSGARLVEKSPCHDDRIEQILALRPGARVLFMVRDPRDVVASRTAPPRSEALRDSLSRWMSSVKEAARWCKAGEGGVGSAFTDPPSSGDDHTGTGGPKPSSRVLLLRYEDLVGKPESTLRVRLPRGIYSAVRRLLRTTLVSDGRSADAGACRLRSRRARALRSGAASAPWVERYPPNPTPAVLVHAAWPVV